MALTYAQFVVLYPEFANTDAAQVNAFLTEALHGLDETVLEGEFDLAHGLSTAHHLASSPFGQNARLNNWSSETPYSARLETILRRRGTAYRIVLE